MTPTHVRSYSVGLAAILLISAATFYPLVGFADAMFWDDWILFSHAPEQLPDLFAQTGYPLTGHLHALLVPFGPVAYKILLVGCSVASGLAVWSATHRLGFGAGVAWCLGAFMVALPINPAKIAAINTMGLVHVAALFIAWATWTRGGSRLWIYPLLVLAFYYPATLVLYGLLWCINLARAHASGLGATWALCRRFADLLAFPFVFFAVQRLFFFSPNPDVAKGYHQFGLKLDRSTEIGPRLLNQGLLELPWVFAVIAVALCIGAVIHRAHRVDFGDWSAWPKLLALGLMASAAALLPFVAVGRLPVFTDWNARYHVLLPFGASLVAVAALRQLRHKTAWVVALGGLLLGLSLHQNWRYHAEYEADWRQQQQVQSLLKSLTHQGHIVIDDRLRYARQRQIRPYEYAAMMRDLARGEVVLAKELAHQTLAQRALAQDRSGVTDFSCLWVTIAQDSAGSVRSSSRLQPDPCGAAPPHSPLQPP